MHGLRRFLVDYDMAMLRAVAEYRGMVLDTNVQSEAVDRLAAALVEPLSVRVALARLSPGARDALQALAAAGGRLRAPQFARAHGHIRPVGPGRAAPLPRTGEGRATLSSCRTNFCLSCRSPTPSSLPPS